MFVIKDVVSKELCDEIVQELNKLEWDKGKTVSDKIYVDYKKNHELTVESDPIVKKYSFDLIKCIYKHPVLQTFSYIKEMTAPFFNKYTEEEQGEFKRHTDSAFQGANGLRTDWSMTIMLAKPEDYEGGDLIIEHDDGSFDEIRLEQGSMILYNSGHIHAVRPVTKGTRYAAIAWAQSYVRNPEQRLLLGRMALNLRKLEPIEELRDVHVNLSSIYTNLIKMWTD